MVVYETSDFLKYMPEVQKCDRSISALNEPWENLKLLCEINCPTHARNILPAMADIQASFSQLQEKLVNTLISETMNKMEQKVVSKSQVAIDILIRNLYERTADVGFLATDDDIRRFVLTGGGPDEAERITQRLRAYVAKYSVYEEIAILDASGRVLAHLDEQNPIGGKTIEDPLLAQTLSAPEGFLEIFRPCPIQPLKSNAHIFASKITADGSTVPVGFICLCFRFENEMQMIFSKLCTDYDGSVLTIINANNTVLASSDATHVLPGSQVEPLVDEAYGIIYYRGQEYIARTLPTQGYQHYRGLGWRGHIMMPLRLAFKDKTSLSGVDADTLSALMAQADSFSQTLHDVIHQTQDINRSLKRIVYNGQIVAREDSADGETARLRPILSSIGKMGGRTSALFQSSVQNLFSTLISTSLGDVSFLASLCVDIMDRNLYERANDCRWWALNPTFRALLSQDSLSAQDTERLSRILAYIHSLYTVYSNLFLFNASGVVIAVSNPACAHLLGRQLHGSYIQGALGNAKAEAYFVSPFEASELYGGQHTYVYSASVTDSLNPGRTVGGIGIVFDSTDQFRSMLSDGISQKNGCFAVFADKKGRVLSCTDDHLPVGSQLAVPASLLSLANGTARSEIVIHDGVFYAVGGACSASYREYKDSDGYQNDVLALVYERLADCAQSTKGETAIIGLEQGDVPLHPQEPHRKLVTFHLSGQLFGVEQEAVVETIGREGMVSIPGASGAVRTMIPHEDRYIAVVNLHKLFEQTADTRERPYLLVIRSRDGIRLALEVDELCSVLEVNASDVRQVPRSVDASSYVSGVASFPSASGNRFLMVINHQMLLSRPDLGKISYDLEKIALDAQDE